jgi:hypothetical protein
LTILISVIPTKPQITPIKKSSLVIAVAQTKDPRPANIFVILSLVGDAGDITNFPVVITSDVPGPKGMVYY